MSFEAVHMKYSSVALRLWTEGRLEEAYAKYTEAIAICPPAHWNLAELYGARAGVCSALGRVDEARQDLELQLELHRESGASDASPRVGVARYLLGHHLIRTGSYEVAITTVMPSIAAGAPIQAPLKAVLSLGLEGLGRSAEAQTAAIAAVAAAGDAQQLAQTQELLAHLLLPLPPV